MSIENDFKTATAIEALAKDGIERRGFHRNKGEQYPIGEALGDLEVTVAALFKLQQEQITELAKQVAELKEQARPVVKKSSGFSHGHENG